MSKKSSEHQSSMPQLNRRQMLGSVVGASSYGLIPLVSSSSVQAQQLPPALSDFDMTLYLSFADRLIPIDENGPGAVEGGVGFYLNRALNEWLSDERDSLAEGLSQINAYAQREYNDDFTALTSQSQELLMTAMEAGQATGFDNGQQVFNRLHRLTLEGMFSDPYYSGNQNYAGWDLIAYPGAVMASREDMQTMGQRLPPLHTSAYGGDFDGN